MGGKSRGKGDRRRCGESDASAEFRRAMAAEDALEDAVACLVNALRRSGIEIQALDLATLSRLCRPVGMVALDGDLVVLVEPTRPIGDAAGRLDFDRRVVQAGLRRFVRPVLPGDKAVTDEIDGMPCVVVEWRERRAS
jgi:hypothetical protein